MRGVPFLVRRVSERFENAAGCLFSTACRMLKTVPLQGRSERKAEAYSEYVEALSEVRTTQGAVFSILLIRRPRLPRPEPPAASVLPWHYATAFG